MTESKGTPFDPQTLMNSWLKTASDFWSGSGAPFPFSAKSLNPDKASSRGTSPFKDFIGSTMGQPEELLSAFQGISSLPDTFLKMTQPVYSGINQMYQKWQAKTEQTGDFIDSFDFSHLDTEVFSIWKKLYDTEFRKFLKAPQLGLTREFQEKVNHFWDRFNILQSTMAEFLHFLYIPFEKTHKTFQEKLAEQARKNELPNDFNSYYKTWLKILEGHYMSLFQSPDYLFALSKTLTASAAYTRAKKDLVNDLLQQLSIPSSANIEGVYKELYEMKKRMMKIEKSISTT